MKTLLEKKNFIKVHDSYELQTYILQVLQNVSIKKTFLIELFETKQQNKKIQ